MPVVTRVPARKGWRSAGSGATVLGVSETLSLTIVYEDGGDGWIVASIPEVPGAHSQGHTRQEPRENVIERCTASSSCASASTRSQSPPATASRSSRPSRREVPDLQRHLREHGARPLREGSRQSYGGFTPRSPRPSRATARSGGGWRARSASSSASPATGPRESPPCPLVQPQFRAPLRALSSTWMLADLEPPAIRHLLPAAEAARPSAAAEAQDRAGAFTLAARRCVGGRSAGSPCTRPASVVIGRGIVAGKTFSSKSTTPPAPCPICITTKPDPRGS